MFDLFTIGLLSVALLMAYLYFSVHRRWRKDYAEWDSGITQTKPIDVTGLNEVIQHVRDNPLSAVQTPCRHIQRRSRLITAARQFISGFSFFRHREQERAHQR